MINDVNQSQELRSVRANTLPETSQLQIDIDSDKAVALSLPLSDVTTTLSAAWGERYVNDFIDQGRVKQVYIQGEDEFRSKPTDIDKWFIRGEDGTMTPFASIASISWTWGPESLA